MQYTQNYQKREKKMKDFESLKTSIKSKVLTVVFNRPEKMNTFSGQMLKDILELLDEAEKDDEIRAVIFTGSGKAFCAGADLSSGEDTFDMSEKGKSKTEVKRDTGGILTLRLFDFKKPLIAAINGAAVGVGVTMTLPMDIRICSEKAKFGFVFAKRGIVPEACSSWFLPKIVGISNALQWCLSGKIFMPQEALDKGLVTEVTSSLSVTLIRQMLWKMLGADHPMEAHKIDSRGVYSLGKTGEASEGVMSFLEKREPNFPGKVSKDLPEFYPWWEDKEFK